MSFIHTTTPPSVHPPGKDRPMVPPSVHFQTRSEGGKQGQRRENVSETWRRKERVREGDKQGGSERKERLWLNRREVVKKERREGRGTSKEVMKERRC